MGGGEKKKSVMLLLSCPLIGLRDVDDEEASECVTEGCLVMIGMWDIELKFKCSQSMGSITH